MKRFLFVIFILFNLSSFAQENNFFQRMDWNGYTQIRASTNFNDHTGFSVRRLKFWIKPTPDFSTQWSYKVQVLFTSFLQERFFLQDARVTYKTGQFSFDFGQYIPRYSLQWTQSDFIIPAIERARVINTLSPNGTLGVRDIGVQMNFATKNKLLQTSIGLFNGYGVFEYRFKNSGYMIAHKSAMNIPLSKNAFQFGYSFLYRKAQDLRIPNVLPDTVLFNGNDVRYNFFVQYKSKVLEIQAEYLNADFDGEKADGYYLLSAINIHNNQIVLSFDDYNDLIPETNNNPYYRLGYNYLINTYKLKLFLDNYFQFNDSGIENYFARIQLQLFFN